MTSLTEDNEIVTLAKRLSFKRMIPPNSWRRIARYRESFNSYLKLFSGEDHTLRHLTPPSWARLSGARTNPQATDHAACSGELA
jgi:hypothetical protein